MRITASAGSSATATPNCRSPSIITRVSSLARAPVKSDGPSARAAQTIARLVMLFEPGGRILARSGPLGRISRELVIVAPESLLPAPLYREIVTPVSPGLAPSTFHLPPSSFILHPLSLLLHLPEALP